MSTTLAVSATLFDSVYDNKTDKQIEVKDFNAFERILYKLADKPQASKKDAVLMSPAIYKEGTTRANKNVDYWGGWCAIDVDDYTFEGKLEDVLSDVLSPYRFVCYSTASSTTEIPKFRVVFPLRSTIPHGSISAFNFALQKAVGSIGDEQTKDLARMYYSPGKYAGAHNFIFSRDGEFINPTELMAKYPYEEKANLNSFFDRLPEAMQEQIIEHRKSQLDETHSNWSSYRHCPFFPRKLENEYRAISNTGWYHKMYQIMVAVASNAIKKKYPITADEISVLCRQLDNDTGNWYANRPIDKEADRALEYVYRNM